MKSPSREKAKATEYMRRYRAKLKADPLRQHIYLRVLEKSKLAQREARKNRGPEIRLRESLYQKEWTKKFPEKRRAAKQKEYFRLRLQTIAAYGGQCACCGEKEPKFLQLDHIEGNGRDRRKFTGRAGRNYYRLLRQDGWPKGYRILCANCHMAISMFRDGCPHGMPSNRKWPK